LESLSPDTTPEQAIDLCPYGDWMLWYADAVAELEIPEAAYRPAVLRAARVYAATACDRAGLIEEAERLRALPEDVTWSQVSTIAEAVVEGGVGAVYYAGRTARAAANAAHDGCDPTAAAIHAYCAAVEVKGVADGERALCANDVRRAMREELLRALWADAEGNPT
jgi:hypothetical protein